MRAQSRELALDEAFWFQEGPGVRKWQFKDNGIKLLNVANITSAGLDLSKTERHLALDEVEKRYSHFLVDEGDLVIASSGVSIDADGFLRTRGAFIDREHLPLCMNTSTIRFKAKDGCSDLRFLKHWFHTQEFRAQITREVTGIAQKNFGPSHLKRLRITLPPLPEQRRIAAILDKADALRQKRREAIAKLDQLLQSVFLEMFGDPVTNPMKWNCVPLTGIGKFKSGSTPNKSTIDFWGGDFPWVSPKDMKTDYIIESVDHVTQVAFERTALKKISPGHLLIVIRGMILARDFPTAINEVEVAINQDMKAIEPHDRFNVLYLKAALDAAKRQLLSVVSSAGHGTKRFDRKDLESILVPRPPIDAQEKFATIVQKIRAARLQNSSSVRRADLLFSAAQQRAFTGKL